MLTNLFHEFFFHIFFRHAADSHCHTTPKNCLKNVFFYKVRHILLAGEKEFFDDCLDYPTTATEADTSGNGSFSNSCKYCLFFLFSLGLKCQIVLLRDIQHQLTISKTFCKGLCLSKITNSVIFIYIFILSFIKLS